MTFALLFNKLFRFRMQFATVDMRRFLQRTIVRDAI
jgi:hypothetical protein